MKKSIALLFIFFGILQPAIASAEDVLCTCSYVDKNGNSLEKTTQEFVTNTGDSSCDSLPITINNRNCPSGINNCNEIASDCKAIPTTYETIRCVCEVYSVPYERIDATIYPYVQKLPNETKEGVCNKKAFELDKASNNTTKNYCKVYVPATTKIEDEFGLKAPTLQVKIPGLEKFSEPPSIMDESGRAYFPWVGEYIRAIYNFGLTAISILAVLMIIVSGIKIVSSGLGGDRKEAYKRITQAVIGLALAWGSYTLLYLINPELLNLKSLGVKLIQPMEIYEGLGEGETGPENAGKCGGMSGKPQTLASNLGLKGDFYQYSNYSTRYGNTCEVPAEPKAVILHYTATPPATKISGIVKYWGNDQLPISERSGASCQIILDRDGIAYQITEKLNEKVICHGGSSGKNWNIGGIGIEIMGENSSELLGNKKQMEAVADLIKKLSSAYNIPLTNSVDNMINGTGGIFSHQQITKCEGATNQKQDPGEEFMKETFKLIGASYIDWTTDKRCVNK